MNFSPFCVSRIQDTTSGAGLSQGVRRRLRNCLNRFLDLAVDRNLWMIPWSPTTCTDCFSHLYITSVILLLIMSIDRCNYGFYLVLFLYLVMFMYFLMGNILADYILCMKENLTNLAMTIVQQNFRFRL